MRFLSKIFILLFFIFVFQTGYTDPGVKPQFATVVFPGGHVFQLEIAKTEKQWIKGLMFRKYLAKNGGMLFLYPKENYYAIWMKNCYISLDILWLDSRGRIIYFIENAKPCFKEPCPVYQPIMKARYVIEVNAGTIKSLKLKTGQRVNILLP